MKELFKNNYIAFTAYKAFVIGVGYHDQILSLMLGPVAFDIYLYMFKSSKRKKPQTF